MFLGMDFFSGIYAMMPNYTGINMLNDVSIQNGTYDHLYVTSDTSKSIENINDEFTYTTKMNANYNSGSLDGGNTAFSLKNTDTIVIKEREKNEMKWVTIYSVPVNTVEDFNFIKKYPYLRGGDAEYDIMVISTVNGIQNAYETTSCKSSFCGLCISDKDTFYNTKYNIEPMSNTRNTNDTVLELLNGKYPTIFSIDSINYDTGKISAFFTKDKSDCTLIEGYDAVKYREEFVDWLTNKKPKILKLDNGEIKMIRVIGKPVISEKEHRELQIITFDFIEIGEHNDESDLYTNNLSDVLPNRW